MRSSRMFGLASIGAMAMSMLSRVGAPDNVSTDPQNPKPPQARLSPRFNSEEQVYKRRMKRRFLAGEKIPQADFDALTRAQAERERKNAHRAFMFRRQEEGVILERECAAYYARLRQHEDNYGRPGGAQHYDRANAMRECGWDRLKQLMQLWDDKMPLEIVLGATAA